MKSLQQLTTAIAGRPFYIWGAHYLGLGLLRALTRSGLTAAGLVDKNPIIRQNRLQGLTVLSPEEFLARPGPAAAAYVIIAATLYEQEIAGELLQAGRRDQADFCRVTDLRSFKYSLEIADRCNLRCPSCPRGNFIRRPQTAAGPGKSSKTLFGGGLMNLAAFQQVLDKIIAEDPLVWEVELYRWGEPLLNPALPEMIGAARDRGLETVISTNLNAGRARVAALAEAGPRLVIVSASGWENSYEATHRGGSWPLFLKNLGLLAQRRRPETEVEIYYHVYRDRRDDFIKMRDLAAELGLTFRPTWAGLLPLDHLYHLAEGGRPNAEVAEVLRMQVYPADQLLAEVNRRPPAPCGLKNLLAVTPELEVPACSCWFDPEEPPLTRDFLKTPLADLIEARRRTPLCRRCEARRLHHLYLAWHEKEGFESGQGPPPTPPNVPSERKELPEKWSLRHLFLES